MLGMYVHTHWSYRHPYAARTWTVRDWLEYLRALRMMGYDWVMFWPLTDAMPMELTISDRAFLAKIQEVIHRTHDELGMKFYITAGANVIGNQHASRYRHEDRPYFLCEWKVNPRDKKEVERFLAGRRQQLTPLAEADALVMIDSDPGGYIGSTDDEFVQLASAQTAIMRDVNPNLEFIYWMWVGWEAYNQFWENAQKSDMMIEKLEWGGYENIIRMLRSSMPEPWSLFVTVDKHLSATIAPDLLAKRMFNPYGLIEGEPSFPLTNNHPQIIKQGLDRYLADPSQFPRGVMANCQTHCLQLPNTYYFAHFSQGGKESDVDLEEFASQILPDCGDVVSAAWSTISTGSADRMRVAAKILRGEIGEPHKLGKLKGLLFGDPDRFLTDLVWNLQVRATGIEFAQMYDQSIDRSHRKEIDHLTTWLKPYQQRVGYGDACGGPLMEAILPRLGKLDDPAVRKAVKDVDEWKILPRRHGCITRLLSALEKLV